MNPLSLLQTLISGLELWQQYGGTVEKAITILNEVDNCIPEQHIISKIEQVLLNNGIDVAAIIATAGGAIDLTSIKGIQNALNVLGANPQLTVDGLYGADTTAAITAFQQTNSLTANGIPSTETTQAMATQLVAKGLTASTS
jgi:Putative peptidoglycan binding domain